MKYDNTQHSYSPQPIYVRTINFMMFLQRFSNWT